MLPSDGVYIQEALVGDKHSTQFVAYGVNMGLGD
jgi:hypothetical protein